MTCDWAMIAVGLILCGLVSVWLFVTTGLILVFTGFGLTHDPQTQESNHQLIFTPESTRNKGTMKPEAGLISFNRYNFNIVLVIVLILIFGGVMTLGSKNLGNYQAKPDVISTTTTPSQSPYQICFETWNTLSITDMSVIVIRGTVFDSGDWIQNADIWQASAILQAGDLLGPGLALWPVKLVRFLVRGLSAMEVLSDRGPDSNYFTRIENYIDSIRSNRSAIFVTGHSLGGGLANIVGARKGLRSVGISAPGIMFAGGKLGISELQIRAWNSNVQPAKDVVPKIDMQGGLNQLIDCSLGVLTCHSSTVTLCRLIESCGQPNNKSLSCCSDNYCAND